MAVAQHGRHVGAVLLRHFVGVAEGEEVLDVGAVEERRAAALAVERGCESGRESAGPSRVRVDERRGLSRERGDSAE